MRTLTLRELNRTLLARQMLLERKRMPVVRAVGRLVAMQAQYAPSPYVALWSRVAGFRKEQLTRALVDGTVVKGGVMRGTLHVVTRDLYPFIQAAHIESQQGRIKGVGTNPLALAAQWPEEPVQDVYELAGRLLGTDDRWTVAFTLRAMPWVRLPPTGEWPYTKPTPSVLWDEPLAAPEDGAARVVRDYLAAYGPASRDDVEQFTSFKMRQIEPALEGMRTFEDEQGRTLYDVARGVLSGAKTKAPVRFLPPFDSIILAHRDRSRILPDAYRETVLRPKNTVTRATFTVDGFIAGAWKVEKQRGRWKLELDPYEPLPKRVRDEVDREGEALVAFYES
ncbi:MAG TPA: winged helix DNA-binding domain-containing protein [Gaiellaceae bacterium]